MIPLRSLFSELTTGSPFHYRFRIATTNTNCGPGDYAPQKMKTCWQSLILLSLVSCSPDDKEGPDGGSLEIPEREVTEVMCPVHQVPVFKVHASAAISCPIWDPKLGLTNKQIRNRFPHAIWDSNLHRLDDTDGAKFPRYNLICDQCQNSWSEYVAANPFPKEKRFVISIPESQKILINGTEFSIDQIPAIAKTVSNHRANPRLHLRASKNTPTELIKAVMSACSEGGITDVIFGGYDKETEPVPEQIMDRESRGR